MRFLAITAAVFLAATPAIAAEHVPPGAVATFRKECGACHIPYLPQFLPKRSWQKIMGNLSNHFGEDASLAEAQRKSILAVLDAYAADVYPSRSARMIARSIPASSTPLRITETPVWLRIHSGVRSSRWHSASVKSKSNCVACHEGAARGNFGEEE